MKISNIKTFLVTVLSLSTASLFGSDTNIDQQKVDEINNLLQKNIQSKQEQIKNSNFSFKEQYLNILQQISKNCYTICQNAKNKAFQLYAYAKGTLACLVQELNFVKYSELCFTYDINNDSEFNNCAQKSNYEQCKDDIQEVIDVIFAKEKDTNLIPSLDEISKHCLKEIQDENPNSFSGSCNFNDNSIIIYTKDTNTIDMSYTEVFLHEFGHFYEYTYLSYLPTLLSFRPIFNTIPPEIISESVSMLFEILSSIILKHPYYFYIRLSGISTILFTLAQYTSESSIDPYNKKFAKKDSPYGFGFLFAINMIHKCGTFQDKNFTFDIQKLKEEYQKIVTYFEHGYNLFNYYLSHYCNIDTINDTLQNIEKFFTTTGACKRVTLNRQKLEDIKQSLKDWLNIQRLF